MNSAGKKPLDIELPVKAQLEQTCKLEKENPEADLLSDTSNNSVPIRGWASASCQLKAIVEGKGRKEIGYAKQVWCDKSLVHFCMAVPFRPKSFMIEEMEWRLIIYFFILIRFCD